MFKFFLSLVFTLGLSFSSFAWADELEIRWNPIPGAQAYEFELSTDGSFKPDTLIRQGESQNPIFNSQIPAGLYFFRVRPLDKGGLAGAWSPAVKKLVKSQSPELRSPKQDETIEISSLSIPIVVEWKGVKGAEDYQVEVQKPGEKNFEVKIVNLTRFQLPQNIEGNWKVKISARALGSVISDSAISQFQIRIKPSSNPRILFPVERDILTAFEPHKLRWIRTVPGEESQIHIYRIEPSPAGRITHLEVSGETESWLPPLPPGRYQITVKDYIDEKQLSQESVTILVEQDPMGFHSQYIGTTWRFISGGPTWGTRSLSNDQMTGFEKITNQGLLDPIGAFSVGSRVQSQIWNPWGSEILFRYDRFKFDNSNSLYGTTHQPFAIVHRQLDLGPTYKWEPWGGTLPILLKGLLSYRRLEQARPKNSVEPYSMDIIDYGLVSLVAGGEIRWGGWKAKYDLSSALYLYFPLFMDKGDYFGRGRPYYFFPYNIDLDLFVRRKIGDVHRFLIGANFKAERLSHSEGEALHNGLTSRGRRTVFTQVSFGPRIAWEWDL